MRLEWENVSPKVVSVHKHIVHSDAMHVPHLTHTHFDNDAEGSALHHLTDNEITNLHTYNIAPKQVLVNL